MAVTHPTFSFRRYPFPVQAFCLFRISDPCHIPIKLWCWLGMKSNHRINHWMNLFLPLLQKAVGFATWSNAPREHWLVTIWSNCWGLFLCPAFLWLRLKVSILELFLFAIVLLDFIIALCLNFWGTKRYIIPSFPNCLITSYPAISCVILGCFFRSMQ